MRYIITITLASAPAFAEVPSVVTDIPPVHSLVAEVMGELGQPELLLGKGADEHDFQLRPSQAAAVVEADLVVWIGPELTPWLDSALDARAGDATLALLSTEGTGIMAYSDEAAHQEETADHATEEQDHAAAGEDHGHDGVDPHAWLDPMNAKHWLDLIAAELSRLDPENASTYTSNAMAAGERIEALDAEVSAVLAPVKDKPMVTFHDAFGYFGHHYDLKLVGSIALGDASSPGAARLVELRAKMETGEVLCIFPEAQHDPALVQQMADGTGAKVGGELDPVGSSLEPGPGAYAALIRGLATTIADCVAG
jgi:zinc transport system substrate-binding protein